MRRPAGSLVLAAALSTPVAVGACGGFGSAPTGEWEELAPPVPDSVDTVVFLIGDAGAGLPGQSPVLEKLAQEVEAWSATLARDSSVAVFYLGDNVYPYGVRPRWEPEFVDDSLRLLSQVLVVGGPEARRFRSPAYFIAGNHDWGQMDGPEGLRRLENEDELLGEFRARGARVDMVPEPGEPGPQIIDLGERARYMVLDTHWWLQAHTDPRQDSVLMKVAEGIRTAEGRDVSLAAHHPFVSGGSHGGPMPIWKGFGLLWLLRKSGSLVQDLNATPYRDLRGGLRVVFRVAGAPLLFAGGHDHSLQVIRGATPEQPRWSLVSGSGSKLTDVGPAPGMLWGLDRPGFMRITHLRGGGAQLHVFVTGDEYSLCDEEDGVPVDACMEAGLEGFEVGYAVELKPGGRPPVSGR